MSGKLFKRQTILYLILSLLLVFAFSSSAGAQDNPLVGELEGVTLRLDLTAADFDSFGEAPMLAERVAAGELPPVEERLPSEPLVIEPLDQIGEYGGTWRRGFVGPGDGENGNRINASDKLLWFDFTGTQVVPSLAKGWEVSDDGTVITLFLREGLKWSDGDDFTADDFTFWFEWLYNDDRITSLIADMAVNGEQGRVEKVDDYTVNFIFPAPNPLFVELLAGDTLIGGGQSVRQSGPANTFGAYAPSHYLSQFIPEISGKTEEELNAEAQEAGFEDWVTRFHFLKDWQLNPDVPRVGPYVTVNPINTDTWVIERNPYYWAIDTAGNQLPYIDRIVFTLGDPQTITLRAMAGEIDMQARHILLTELPALIENQESGNYTLHLDTAINGSDAVIQLNQSYNADPEIAKWLTNVDFRRALSMGLDRDQMNEAFWLGTGTPGSVIPGPISPQNPGEETYRNLWSTLDVERANQLLDEIGLSERDDEGFRVRTDNGERLRFELQAINSFLPWVQISEMAADQWARNLGIQVDVVELERTLFINRARDNEHQMAVWTNNGSSILYLFPRHAIPVDPTEAFMGPAFAQWFVSGGERGI
ncbi:MAG: ABC transporter substrate-binding protein, partial [Chloroflexi bacterium]